MKPQSALVFFDIDGTLLDKNHQVPASAVEAIAQLRANGHLAFINTGRCMAMVDEASLGISFDGIVASCGTHITFGSETLQNILMPSDLLQRAIDLMHEHHIDFWLEGPEHVVLDMQKGHKAYHEYVDFFGKWPQSLIGSEHTGVKANKFSYLLNEQSRFDQVEPFLREHFDIIIHRDDHGEVFPRGFSKATGMATIKRYLNRPDATTFAFGDSLNDLDMLKAADIGIAMGGSRSRLIAHSNHLTDTPDAHGIQNALRHYQLID